MVASSVRAVDVISARAAVVVVITDDVVTSRSQNGTTCTYKQPSEHCNKYLYQILIITSSVTETFDILIISFLESSLGYSNTVTLSTQYILHVWDLLAFKHIFTH